MTKWFLCLRLDEDRRVITSVPGPGDVIEDEAVARSWVEAKRRLGYPLTAVQELMLLAAA